MCAECRVPSYPYPPYPPFPYGYLADDVGFCVLNWLVRLDMYRFSCFWYILSLICIVFRGFLYLWYGIFDWIIQFGIGEATNGVCVVV